MSLLCAPARPNDAHLLDWLTPGRDGYALQDFACHYGPVWAQGIAVIDVALSLANTPTEGPEHETQEEFTAKLSAAAAAAAAGLS